MKRSLLLVGCVVSILFFNRFGQGQDAGNTPPPATVTGSGTANFVPKWTGTTTLGNSVMFQTSGRIGVGTTVPSVALDVNGRVNVSKSYRIANVDVLSLPGTENTAVGYQTLETVTSGAQNTAVGFDALQFVTTGTGNTGMGWFALENNDSGENNTANGDQALAVNLGGSSNTADGAFALQHNSSGIENTATGFQALSANTTGQDNTASGTEALLNNTTGKNNIAIGFEAALLVNGMNSNNIHIGSKGTFGDQGAIHIGTNGTQTSFFASGVNGVTTGMNDAVPVVVDSRGQLGTVSSSRRYKEDIQEMGDTSQGLMRLRPVSFRYQKAFSDGSKPVQFGLIAEEVAEVYPDLVTHTADGQVETVKYQVLDSMLLNEVQRQQKEIQSQQKMIQNLEQRLEKMESELAAVKQEPGN